jgi:hypothetical protein
MGADAGAAPARGLAEAAGSRKWLKLSDTPFELCSGEGTPPVANDTALRSRRRLPAIGELPADSAGGMPLTDRCVCSEAAGSGSVADR